MSVLALLLLTFAGYGIAYRIYGRFLAKRVFKLSNTNTTPAVAQSDGKDFVASERHVMFGHHFTTIAGTGPIVGPAIGVIWGWVPAALWIFFGSIFFGAVHDFSTLVISLRNKGQSLFESAKTLINDRVRALLFCIIFLALLIVIAIFGLVIALIFSQFPSSVFPVWAEIPIAILLGRWALQKGKNLVSFTLIAVLVMYLTVFIGVHVPIELSGVVGIPSTGLWTLILLTYAFIASILPVQTLLQPRDFLNAWQLYVAIGCILLGIVALGPSFSIIAPSVQSTPTGAPNWAPFLFITIACGAISGFHSLVCSGTTAKQVKHETDALYIGYGAMLMEGAFAILVIVAVTAGIGLGYNTDAGVLLTGQAAFDTHYSSWQASSGLGSKLSAVVIGFANIMQRLGIPADFGVAIVGMLIASFAGTTLDSATRIQRYVISDFFKNTPLKGLSKPKIATAIAVGSAAALAFSSGADGKGALLLWPLFGAVNQLLAGLALMIATAYLAKKKRMFGLLTGIPCVIMLIITVWSAVLNQKIFLNSGLITLSILNSLILILTAFICFEAIKTMLDSYIKTKKAVPLERSTSIKATPPPTPTSTQDKSACPIQTG